MSSSRWPCFRRSRASIRPTPSSRVRIVQDGPTLALALDAHAAHAGPFAAEELLPYRTAREPPCQRDALNRRKIMRKARSKKKRPILLTELERRYRESPSFKLDIGSLLLKGQSIELSALLPLSDRNGSSVPDLSRELCSQTPYLERESLVIQSHSVDL
jgi:hypothetical protein